MLQGKVDTVFSIIIFGNFYHDYNLAFLFSDVYVLCYDMSIVCLWFMLYSMKDYLGMSALIIKPIIPWYYALKHTLKRTNKQIYENF